MSWLARRPSHDSEEPATMRFASEFAAAVDRSFQIDDGAIDRIRGSVLGAFVEAAPTVVAPLPGRPHLVRPARRGLTIALVATVGVVAFGSLAVRAQPGDPFYSLRLAVETATLPSIDAPAGWAARLERLQHRIDESVVAGRSGNNGAVLAGLGEYRAELGDLNGGLVDPGRRASMVAAVSRDIALVVGLEAIYPSETARLLVADMQAIIGSTDPNGGDSGPGDPATGDPHDGATGNPHIDGATGNPHEDGETGDPHGEDAVGDPHDDGETGNPHPDGETGNPHENGATGNPHEDGASGNPHDDKADNGKNTDNKKKPHAGGSTGNPPGRGGGNPHPDGKGDPKGKQPAN